MSQKAHFSTKARVVDLLGREQIADAPTAITELLKNAIDAAASKADVRYNTKTRCLEIEDDGLGMRLEDVKNKWMVLATDSKHGKEKGDEDKEWTRYATPEQLKKLDHKPLGEKGIGRLAVAALGNGTLVWTRWGKGNDAQSSLLLVHWHFFRHSTFLLDEIKFPIAEVKPEDNPKEVALRLCEEFAKWFEGNRELWKTNEKSDREEQDKLFGKQQGDLSAEIENDLRNIFPRAIEEIQFNLEMGTLFGVLGVTKGVDEIYEQDKELSSKEEKFISEGLRTFFGFSNPFLKEGTHLNVNATRDGIPAFGSDLEFWTPEDLKDGDHFIDIKVDDEGFAKGKLIQSKSKEVAYEKSFSYLLDKGGKPGGFRVILGYVPGEFHATVLTKPNFDRFTKRLREFGGLYVYRDGIRVMPYGRFDNDFLSFDERRARHAGRYYFAYRRMFGAILITSEQNSRLQDKAGREGFIKNNDYRTFRNILIDLFIDLAFSYLGIKAQKKKEKKSGNAGEAYKERVEQEKKEFFEKFNQAKLLLEKGSTQFDKKTKECLKKLDSYETKVIQDITEFDDIEAFYYDLVSDFNRTLDQLMTEEPQSFTLEERYLLTWDDYLNNRQEFETSVQKRLNKLVARIEKINAEFKQEKERIEIIKKKIEKNNQTFNKEINESKTKFTSQAKTVIDNSQTWESDQKRKLEEIFTQKIGNISPQEIAADKSGEKSALLEEVFAKQKKLLREDFIPFWTKATNQLRYLADATSSEFALGAMNREFEKLQEKDRTLSELAQLGLVVETVSHEYHEMFKKANSIFNKIQSNTDTLPQKLIGELSHLENIFHSIDERLRFLDPLYQRKGGGMGNINGMEIRNFVENSFDEEYRRGVIISYTKKFLNVLMEKVKTPVLYAAIFNVVNNALYWVQKNSDKPEIRFSHHPNGFVISDTGPGISTRDRDNIFEPFFSRRPQGRGLGLYIVKTTLEAAGMSIMVAEEPETGALPGANFIIKKAELLEDDDDNNI